jgi:hypothetical protein
MVDGACSCLLLLPLAAWVPSHPRRSTGITVARNLLAHRIDPDHYSRGRALIASCYVLYCSETLLYTTLYVVRRSGTTVVLYRLQYPLL